MENFSTQNKDVLINRIKYYNQTYRIGHPEISDAEYDQLVDQLKRIDPNNEWFQHIEPAIIPNNRKRTLPVPMKSLNKVKSMSELKKWYQSLGLTQTTGLVCMPKFDGLSLLCNEITGEAFSRGGAENEGQDCTAHYQDMSHIKHKNGFQYTYGEFVISRANWHQYFQGKNSELTGEPFKSPRNTAAGLLNRDNPCRYLQYATFFRYGINAPLLKNYTTFYTLIEDICTIFNQEHLYGFYHLDELTEDVLANLFKEWSALYPIDGIVVYLNDLYLWEAIGRHQTTGNPLYAIAYKHPDFTETFETTVKDITWKASKSGALKPVVNIEMVDTGDCNMENPTGYNAGWINDHEIAKGAKILVTRSGGVIPKILSVIEPANETEQSDLWDDLAECPHCQSPTRWNENGIELCCTNPQCDGRLLAKAVFFYTTCGAENIGEETLAKIFKAGYTTIPQMLNVTYDQLIHIDGFGDGIANIILDNNQRIMQGVDAATLMQASDCFTGVGKIKAQKWLDEIGQENIDLFYKQQYILASPDSEQFKKLNKTQQAFAIGLPLFYQFVDNTQIPILLPQPAQDNQNGVCANMSVCMSGFRDAKIEQYIKSEGGTIVSGVSKKTTHLIVKDKAATSSKINKALEFGVQIIDIDEFSQKYRFCI